MVETKPEKEIEELKGEPVKEYNLTYDSMGEGIEPIYFWTLDFMRDTPPSGLGLEQVEKTGEDFEAAVGSAFFGDMGTRRSVMQDRAMTIMERVNAVVRSIINLVYDLREFDIKLETYDDLHSEKKEKKESAKLALKDLWMSKVDIQKGRGAINMLAQQLEFVTLRDAFMAVKSLKEVDKIDLNDRVKRILKNKLTEYEKWEKHSEAEIRKRYNIEKSYLKSQVNALKLYTQWAKPYLKSAQQLGMKDFKSPDIVSIFDNMQVQLKLFGKTKINPEKVHPSYKKLKFGDNWYACLEVDFIYRVSPRAVERTQAGSHYVQPGKVDIKFKAYALPEEKIKKIEELEEKEGIELIEGMTEASLKELHEDLDKYLKDEKTEEKIEKKERKKSDSPFVALYDGFKEFLLPLKDLFKFSFKPTTNYPEKQVKTYAEDQAKTKCEIIYDIYKKAHGMVTW